MRENFPRIIFQQQFYPSKRFEGYVIRLEELEFDIALDPSLEKELENYLPKSVIVLIYLPNKNKPLIAEVFMAHMELDKRANLIINMKINNIKSNDLDLLKSCFIKMPADLY